jgi:hypothetical protein
MTKKKKHILICVIACALILPLLIIIFIIGNFIINFTIGFRIKDKEAIDIYKDSAYYQNIKDFQEFTDGIGRYVMRLNLGNTEFELLLQEENDEWRGTLTYSMYEREIESFNAQIVDEYLIIHSEPQREVLLTDFFFAQFSSECFENKRKEHFLFTSSIIEVNGTYDHEKGTAFLELFYQNFISVFSSFGDSDNADFYRYFSNIDELYRASFTTSTTTIKQTFFRLYFSLEDYDYDIVFAEKMYEQRTFNSDKDDVPQISDEIQEEPPLEEDDLSDTPPLWENYDQVIFISENRVLTKLFGECEENSERVAFIYDAEGNVISNGVWRDIRFGYYNGYATTGIGIIYIPDGEEGYGEFLIDQDGNKISPTRYDSITMGGSERFNVLLNDEWFVVDSSGNLIEPVEPLMFYPAADPNQRGRTPFHLPTCGEWFYFSRTSLSGETGLFKIRTDMSEEVKISDVITNNTSLIGDWIYYYIYSFGDDDVKGIYRIRTDGTEHARLTSGYVYNLHVVGDWIYFNKDGAIYRIRTDGTQGTQIIDGSYWYIIHEDWIYYHIFDWRDEDDKNGLYKIRLDGTGEIKLHSGRIEEFAVYDGWIYFLDWSEGTGGERRNLYRSRTDGSNRELLLDSVMTRFIANIITIENDWIYFTCWWDFDMIAGTLFKMRTDGSEVLMFHRGYRSRNSHFAKAGEWLHFVEYANYDTLFVIPNWEPDTFDWKNVW